MTIDEVKDEIVIINEESKINVNLNNDRDILWQRYAIIERDTCY